MDKSARGMLKQIKRGTHTFRIGILLTALLIFSIFSLSGCQTVPARDMSNDLIPAQVAGYTTSVHDERYHTATSTPELDVVVREDVSGYVNLTVWVTNKSKEAIPFAASLATLSVRSRDGHGKTYLPMGMESYLEKVLKCYYEKEGYEDFKNSVRKNYLKDTKIEPGQTVAGILRYEILAERSDTYTLKLPFGEKEVDFKYIIPHQ